MGISTQEFYYAVLSLVKDGDPITQQDINYISNSFNTVFNPDNKNVNLDLTIEQEDEYTLSVSMGDGDCRNSFYEFDCDYDSYSPGRMYMSNGDPGYPDEGGLTSGYERMEDMFYELWTSKYGSGWNLEIEDGAFTSLDAIWDNIMYGGYDD